MTDVLQPTDVALVKEETRRSRFGWWWLALVAGVILLQFLVTSTAVPPLWDTVISGPIDQFATWARENRQIHPIFTGFFIPFSAAVDWGLTTIESFLKWLPWFVLPLVVFLVIFRTGNWKMATVAALAMVYPGLVGLWDTTMETLSLMAIAVLIALAIGIPLVPLVLVDALDLEPVRGVVDHPPVGEQAEMLEDHRHLVPAHLSQLVVTHGGQVLAIQDDPPARHFVET